ncbi:MAG: hypothetical protein WBD99_09815 [Thermodesulfobacteriota bacterium]
MKETTTVIPTPSSKSAFKRRVVIASDGEAISSFWGLHRRRVYPERRRRAPRNDSLHYAQSLNRILNKHYKTEMTREASCYNSLLSFKRINTPIIFVTLILTFLILTLSGESAYSQCAGLCLYGPDISETKISAQRLDRGHGEYAKDHFGSEGTEGPDRNPLITDLPGEPSGDKSSIFPGERIRVSQGLSDKFATNDMYSAERVSENSGPSAYASNDAEANSNPQTSNSKDWEFIVIPYGWFTSISEDIVVNGQGAEGHATFINLLEHLDIAGMLYGEVWWKGKLGIFADTIYSKLALNKDVTLRRLGSISAGLQTTMFIQEFGGLYRVGSWPIGSPYNQFVQRSKPSVTFNILAGGRYWHLKNELDVRGPLGILSRQIDQSQNWFDFIVGGRARLEFYKKLFLELTTDIGGFDLSFSSKFSWNVLAVVGYELSWYRITPLIGFRALYDNYANGSGNSRFDSKMWMYGPALGVAFKF